MGTTGERIDFLRKEAGLSFTDLAVIIEGITGDGVRKAVTRNSVKPNHINILCDKLKWDKKWILGEESIDDKSERNELAGPTFNYGRKEKLFKKIPFYDINVSAGDIVFMDNGMLKGQTPDDYLHIPINVDADIAFPTFGHSMYPEISNGDRVAYKFIKDWSFFNYGMKYLIVTDEQRMVKYLKRSTIVENVLLTSRNEDYEDIEMPVNSIRSILQVRYICKIEM